MSASLVGSEMCIRDSLKTLLPTSLQRSIQPFQLRYERNQEILVPVSSNAPEVVDIWNNRLKTEDSLKYNNKVLYVVPERSEAEKPRYRAIGKLKGFLDTKAPG
eukprot:584079-Alexandrium_andersonii.AAC.1